MTGATLLISLSDHHASWNWDSLDLKCFNGQHCAVSWVSVIGSSSSVKFTVSDDRNAWTKPFVPSCEWRLFIKMSVEKDGFIEISFNFSEDDRTEFLDLDDLWLGSFNMKLFDPVSDVFSSFLEEAISLPIGIKASWKIGYFDVLHQGWNIRLGEYFLDVLLTDLDVKFFALHSTEIESLLSRKYIINFLIIT